MRDSANRVRNPEVAVCPIPGQIAADQTAIGTRD